MNDEILLSVGIDLGTSTTQCVFSALHLVNSAPAFAIARIEIREKKVVYRAPLRLTPLLSPDMIDLNALREMIRSDYRAAGVRPQDIRCGAAIITGETALKQNARAVLEALSEMAGDFVVATAGPELESILAGRGSGAAAISKRTGKSVLNLDIGGGTTNVCLFERGEPQSTGALNIGGRLIRFEEPGGRVSAFTRHAEMVANEVGISLDLGRSLSEEEILRICTRMTQVIEETANFRKRTPLHEALTLGHAITDTIHADLFTFSGGVANCIYGNLNSDIAFCDLGETLGKCVAGSLFFQRGRTLRPEETQSATVIGAGAYSVAVSGSTIAYDRMTFPIRNMQVGKVVFTQDEDIEHLDERIREQVRILSGECAIGFDGIRNATYDQIERAARKIASGMAGMNPRVILCAQDMAKALGQALMRRWGDNVPMLCLDGLSLTFGDMVSIGTPLSDGRVVPVVVKTLAFSNESSEVNK